MDVLSFKGVAAYGDRLKSYQEKTGLKDAVQTGFGKLLRESQLPSLQWILASWPPQWVRSSVKK